MQRWRAGGGSLSPDGCGAAAAEPQRWRGRAGVEPGRLVSNWVVHITSPPDGRYAPLAPGPPRKYKAVRALVLPVQPPALAAHLAPRLKARARAMGVTAEGRACTQAGGSHVEIRITRAPSSVHRSFRWRWRAAAPLRLWPGARVSASLGGAVFTCWGVLAGCLAVHIMQSFALLCRMPAIGDAPRAAGDRRKPGRWRAALALPRDTSSPTLRAPALAPARTHTRPGRLQGPGAPCPTPPPRAQVSLRWECAASRTGGQAAMAPVGGRGPLWQAAWPRERPCRLDPGDRVVSLQARAANPR